MDIDKKDFMFRFDNALLSRFPPFKSSCTWRCLLFLMPVFITRWSMLTAKLLGLERDCEIKLILNSFTLMWQLPPPFLCLTASALLSSSIQRHVPKQVNAEYNLNLVKKPVLFVFELIQDRIIYA